MNLYETTYGYIIRQGATTLSVSAYEYPTPAAAMNAGRRQADRLRIGVGRNNVSIFIASEGLFGPDREQLEWQYRGDTPERMNLQTPIWETVTNMSRIERLHLLA